MCGLRSKGPQLLHDDMRAGLEGKHELAIWLSTRVNEASTEEHFGNLLKSTLENDKLNG